MVHNRRFCHALLFQAPHTQGMRFQVTLPGFSPPVIVSSASRTWSVLRMKRGMFLTELTPCRNQLRAAGMSARYLWLCWHRDPSHEKRPCDHSQDLFTSSFRIHFNTSFSLCQFPFFENQNFLPLELSAISAMGNDQSN